MVTKTVHKTLPRGGRGQGGGGLVVVGSRDGGGQGVVGGSGGGEGPEVVGVKGEYDKIRWSCP